MLRSKLSLLVMILAVTSLVACGGGGGGSSDSSGTSTRKPGSGNSNLGGNTDEDGNTDDETDTDTETDDDTSTVPDTGLDEVPVAGQFLATCLDSGVAILESFVPANAVALPEPPALSSVVPAEVTSIPVLGGLLSGIIGGSSPLGLDAVLSMIPADGLPSDLPVIGTAPVNCSDVPLNPSALPLPAEVVGLVPVFDANGDPIAVLLATVGQTVPPAPADATLPDGIDTLPDEIGGVVDSLLGGLLGGLGL